MSGRLAGKVAIVTGAGRGIGAATVRRLAAEGGACPATRRVAPCQAVPSDADRTHSHSSTQEEL